MLVPFDLVKIITIIIRLRESVQSRKCLFAWDVKIGNQTIVSQPFIHEKKRERGRKDRERERKKTWKNSNSSIAELIERVEPVEEDLILLVAGAVHTLNLFCKTKGVLN